MIVPSLRMKTSGTFESESAEGRSLSKYSCLFTAPLLMEGGGLERHGCFDVLASVSSQKLERVGWDGMG